MIKFLFYIPLVMLLSGCALKEEYVLLNQSGAMQEGLKGQTQPITTQIDGANFEYKIRPHDRIVLSVYRHPELSTSGTQAGAGNLGQSILVNAQGNIELPLIETIHVAGLSQPQAQQLIQERFREYLRHPSVQLEVINKRAYILGEVHRPGPIELQNEQIPLLQVLSMAGDLTPHADRHAVMILKNHGTSIESTLISLTGKDSMRLANQMIRPNDVVYVVPKEMSLFNNKVGEINPIFQLVTNALTPFLTIRLLTQ